MKGMNNQGMNSPPPVTLVLATSSWSLCCAAGNCGKHILPVYFPNYKLRE